MLSNQRKAQTSFWFQPDLWKTDWDSEEKDGLIVERVRRERLDDYFVVRHIREGIGWLLHRIGSKEIRKRT